MERLTEREIMNNGNVGYNRCYFKNCDANCGECEVQEEVALKLKAYEDAEEQGLLLRLPCKVGDTVYTNLSSSGWYFRSNDRPYPAKVVFIGLNNSEEFGGGFINVSFDKKAGCMMQFRFCDIGNLVFLTKEEAEQKLAEMKGE